MSESQLREWGAKIRDPAAPVVARAHAMWGLRSAKEPLATQLLAAYITEVVPTQDPTGAANALIQHECAYALGQRKDPTAVPHLEKVLREVDHEPIVRHEAAEALAALCATPGVDMAHIKTLLEEYAKCDIVPIAETCQIGLSRIDWLQRKAQLPIDPAASHAEAQFPHDVDPSPAFVATVSKSNAELRAVLADCKASLPDRYHALFSLRNASIGHADDAELIDAMKVASAAPGSALLRHEAAFVLGQLSIAKTGGALVERVLDPKEAPMVRHEAALALGKMLGKVEHSGGGEDIATRARDALKQMSSDPEPVVKDSCILALDMADHPVSM